MTCTGTPETGPKLGFRHFSSTVTSAIGGPRHRGIDLIATASAASQTLAGAISYTIVDKALEDEDVDLFVCRAGSWNPAGRARTDDEGRFALELTGARRLPIGLRDLFVSVAGDRTGTQFLAYVAPAGAALIASDIDGTLTSSEHSLLMTILTGVDAEVRAGAPQALGVARARGYQLVYVTARAERYTDELRGWLERKGLPRGPLRLSPSFVTRPGAGTIAYKTEVLKQIEASGLELVAGIGNRATDIAAYTNAGIAHDRIFIQRTGFPGEVQPEIAAGHAIGFVAYDELKDTYLGSLPRR